MRLTLSDRVGQEGPSSNDCSHIQGTTSSLEVLDLGQLVDGPCWGSKRVFFS